MSMKRLTKSSTDEVSLRVDDNIAFKAPQQLPILLSVLTF
jgi:hypothetical protein